MRRCSIRLMAFQRAENTSFLTEITDIVNDVLAFCYDRSFKF
jgi:hypothetical protein